MQTAFINQFIEQFNQRLGPGLASLNSELRQQVHTAAMSAFSKVDLVTREEFDTQQAVLRRTREKLEALETQVTALEQALQAAGNQAPADPD